MSDAIHIVSYLIFVKNRNETRNEFFVDYDNNYLFDYPRRLPNNTFMTYPSQIDESWNRHTE